MQVKAKAPIQTSRKTFKRHADSLNLEELAKRAMPKWRVAGGSAQDSPATLEVDAVSPKLGELRVSAATSRSGKRQVVLAKKASESDSPSGSRHEKRSGLVNMLPNSDEDARTGAKTQVFEDDEHTGAQG